jgi:hypothetical protein
MADLMAKDIAMRSAITIGRIRGVTASLFSMSGGFSLFLIPFSV